MIYLDAASTAKYSNVDDLIVDTITYSMKKYWQNLKEFRTEICNSIFYLV